MIQRLANVRRGKSGYHNQHRINCSDNTNNKFDRKLFIHDLLRPYCLAITQKLRPNSCDGFHLEYVVDFILPNCFFVYVEIFQLVSVYSMLCM